MNNFLMKKKPVVVHSKLKNDFQTIVLHYPSRTGSTLLCQMFHKLPNTLVQSDPFIHHYVQRMFKTGNISKKQMTDLVRSCTKVLFKAHNSVRIHLLIYFTLYF